ncbi:MAG: hypothetical protein JWO71_4770 [Candidatus Acidoferrum typicum]|nr:hypothetical protein [Candidatus Acidoferrum typicum]
MQLTSIFRRDTMRSVSFHVLLQPIHDETARQPRWALGIGLIIFGY